MRWALGFIILVTVCWFAAVAIGDLNTLRTRYSASFRMMDSDVEAAVRNYTPALKISNLYTFGKAGKTHREFYQQLARTAAIRFGSPTFSGVDAGNVQAALKAIHQATKISTDEILDLERRILDQAVVSKTRIGDEGLLSDWDSYVATLDKISRDQTLTPELHVQLAGLLDEVRQVDRFPIAHRTVLFHINEQMMAAFGHLGVAAPALNQTAQLTAADVGGSFGEAEAAFVQAWNLALQFLEQWPGQRPRDVMRYIPIGQHNHAMCRLLYAVSSLNASGNWSFYYDPTFISQGSSPEVDRQNFLIGMLNGFHNAIAAVGQFDPGNQQLVLSCRYSLAIAMSRLARNPSEAETHMTYYRTLNPRDPAASQPVSTLPPRFVFFN